MNKLIILVTLFAAVGAGCSSGDTTTTTLPDGSKATVSTSKDGMTLQGNGTEAAVGAAAKISEEQLHVPFYPGAQMINDKSMSVKTPTEESALAYFTTTDDVEKIVAFYKEKLKGIEFNKFEDGEAVNLISKEYKDSSSGRVAIAVTRKSASGPVEISIGWGKESK